MKKLFSDSAFRFQALKVLALALLLIWPFRFHKAIAEKNPPNVAKAQAAVQKDAQRQIKRVQKENKKKKGKAAPAQDSNQLTREAGRKLIHQRFEVPPSIQPAVDFWKMVYTKYDRRFEVFHDIDDLSRIYSVLDFSALYDNRYLSEGERRTQRKERIDAEKDRIRSVLQLLAASTVPPNQLSAEEKKIYDLFKDDPNPRKFIDAAEGRIRSQTGIKDKFAAGVANSGAYMEEMEDIFTSYGLPVELTRLVFVESMFNTRARSKVGASGLWQFMPSTGKLYINIDSILDERNHPIMATHAAAQLLKSNYQALGTWPLAINAYNSGRGTMQNAVRSMGTTQIEEIINYYRGGVYGFASRNFYPSFLAALQVANRYQDHFGKINRLAPVQHEEYTLQNAHYLGTLAAAAGTNAGEIADLNPQYCDEVLNDLKRIPSGYAIRVPRGFATQFNRAELQLNTAENPQAFAGDADR